MISQLGKDVQNAMKRKGYAFFDNFKPYNLNIVGIRSKCRNSGKFDDKIGVIYRNNSGAMVDVWFPATTDSGTFYLRNPLNKRGTAILLAGQYRGAYKLGIHGRSRPSGGYLALEQKGLMKYVRDNNRDDILDFSGVPFLDNIKSNLHRAHPNKIVDFIYKYSASCQVIQNPEDFDQLILIVRKSLRKGFTNSFTYTLLNETDL